MLFAALLRVHWAKLWATSAPLSLAGWAAGLLALLCCALPMAASADSLPGIDQPFIGWYSPFVAAGSHGASRTSFIPGVWTQTVWDDGSGPALYVAGNLVTMNDAYSPGIARWDGSAWSALPLFDRLDEVRDFAVLALAVYQGELIIAGVFSDIEGQPAHNIVRFDGQHWHPLAGSSGVGTNGMVTALGVYQGELIVGGTFSEAGGLAASRLARWDGTDWQAVSHPFQHNADYYVMTEFQGELVVGGELQASDPAISQVARWNGSAWYPLSGPSGEGVGQDPGFGVSVRALYAAPGVLYVGGRFASAGGLAARNIASWDGSAWAALGQGLGGVTQTVDALEMVDGTLVAGGYFPGSGTVESNNIIAWENGEWLAMSGPDGHGTGFGDVLTLQTFDGQLYLGGGFAGAGGVLSSNFARWTGTEFARVTSGPVTAPQGGGVPKVALMKDGQLIVGGGFTEAGPVAGTRRIAAWDGTAWHGFDGGLSPGEVTALALHQGELIAGGGFNFAPDVSGLGGQTVRRVARWDGSVWQPMASGFSGPVEALHVHHTELYAGGSFTASTVGGPAVPYIARWTGSGWETVDGGLGGTVRALATHNDELVAAGNFTTLGDGSPANGIAVWNASDGWRALGEGLSNVNAVVSFHGELYAGGFFGGPFSSTGPSYLARWDGAQWQPVPRGADELEAGGVYHLAVAGNELFVGGSLTRIGDLELGCLARYSPTRGWRALPGPNGVGLRRDCSAHHLLPVDDALVAVGSITVAGGRVANRIAYWSLLEDGIFRDRFQFQP